LCNLVFKEEKSQKNNKKSEKQKSNCQNSDDELCDERILAEE